MKAGKPCVLAVNGGSSSIKFALYETGESLVRLLEGRIEGVGLSRGSFTVKGLVKSDTFSRPVAAPNHKVTVSLLMDWLQERLARGVLIGVWHRVVHGGPKYWEPQRITPEMIGELRQLSPFDGVVLLLLRQFNGEQSGCITHVLVLEGGADVLG